MKLQGSIFINTYLSPASKEFRRTVFWGKKHMLQVIGLEQLENAKTFWQNQTLPPPSIYYHVMQTLNVNLAELLSTYILSSSPL